jgi:PAS domain S-box-containing protein
MTSPATPPSLAGLPFPAEMLQPMLDVSLTAINLLRPVYAPGGQEIQDFDLQYLNPAGQRIMRLPEQPGGTLLSHLPHALATGIFAFYCHVFETGEAGRYKLNYPHNGLDQHFHLAAQRCGEQLLVSFSADAAPQAAHPAMEEALHASQAREQAARTEAEAQRGELKRVVEQAPVALAIARGPDLVVEAANPAILALWGKPAEETLGKPLLEAVTDVPGPGHRALFESVLRTGQPVVTRDHPAPGLNPDGLETPFFDFVYQPLRDEQGAITGVITVATEVTQFVQTRQQVQDLNEKLAAANGKLQGLNAGLRTTNAALLTSQGEQQQVNDELEIRVAERTLALKHALAAAETQRQRLHELFEQLPLAVAVLQGPEYVIELANPTVCTLWGRTPEETMGTALFELLPEIRDQGFKELLDEVVRTGQPYAASELPSVLVRDGKLDTLYWDFVYQPLRDPSGRVTGVTVLATEVSAQVNARLHLAAQQQLQAVFELAPVAIGVFAGPDYVVEVCNPGLQAIWGLTAEQVLNRPLFEVLPETRHQGFKEQLDEVVRTGVPYVAHEVPLQVNRQGHMTTIYVNFVYHPLRNEQGQTTAIVKVATDVTEQVAARHLVQRLNEANVQRLNEELAVSNEELRSANQELLASNQQLVRTNGDLDNFIYTASHDLKAPISNIEGLLSALLVELPTAIRLAEPVRPLLDMMHESVERFQQTIVQLTDISKLQLAHAQVAEQVNLAALVEHVRLDLAPVLAAAGARFTVQVQACPTVSFSPKNLRSILYNLLSNAVKYQDPARAPEVQLRCHRAGPTVVLEVQDNGLGLCPHQQSRLFGMFQRLHDHVEGSGIGLYMVKKMVENAGGTINVQSQPGVGSTFTVTFPG